MSPEIPISPPIRTACLRASVPDRISITSSSLPYSRRAGRVRRPLRPLRWSWRSAPFVHAQHGFPVFRLARRDLRPFKPRRRTHERHGKSRSGGLYHRHNCRYLHVCFPAFNMVSGGSTNLLERYYNQYMQEYQMTPDNGTTTDGNTI